MELSRGTAREAIRCLVNEERAELGLRALERDRRLQRASQRHTARMDGTGCFSHQCPGERSLERRLKRYLSGRPRRYLFGEALAWQPGPLASPRQIVDQLMNSAEHRFHLLHPKYDEVGVGFTTGTPQSALAFGGIYTLNFGMRVG
ncbi:MAG TPA: CAP domain-containing protein [Solirubrobacterales bacterium]|nr:CAP domain-containing protein [Solirubrobacterales bacterium]